MIIKRQKIYSRFTSSLGGAIKGAVRGDYFYGSGGDDVLEAAGKMNSQGRYFVLIPKHYEVEDND